jgi:hypothetical protein
MREVLAIVLGQPAYSAIVLDSGDATEVTIPRQWIEIAAMGDPNWELAAALEPADDEAGSPARRLRVLEVLRRPGQVWAQTVEPVTPQTDPRHIALRTMQTHEGFTALTVFSSMYEAQLFIPESSRVPVPTPQVIEMALQATDGILLNPGEPTEFLALSRAELTALPG